MEGTARPLLYQLFYCVLDSIMGLPESVPGTDKAVLFSVEFLVGDCSGSSASASASLLFLDLRRLAGSAAGP